ncbi:YhfC family intramembrane metalloprotease [Schleiferilactobacillus perolens]|uniref:Membrane protein n=1 Tax=Schleiferilactobacillus perolens DSM 12744 TaxID=1423792 RepID=A0A0R1N1R2_9LACO|nr:YhfC family glutamic-type intramembrane protease [Schleiferilactobacillus perolens]KRL11322.1 membrane protein [Schleiferilactobacillus perolens DSM 12744]
MVTSATLTILIVTIALSILIPVGAAFWWIHRHPAVDSWATVGVGLVVYILFAMLLETPFRGIAANFKNTPWLYALYGALLAGVFEEIGRWLGMRHIMKKGVDRLQRPGTPLLYGLGHGGIEMVIIGGFSTLSTLVLSFTINQTGPTAFLQKYPLLASTVKQLTGGAAGLFSLALAERIMALILQIGFSILVWHFVRTGKKFYWVGVPILVHAVVDFVPALSQAQAIGTVATELILLVLTVAFGVIMYRQWRQDSQAAVQTGTMEKKPNQKA